MTTTRGDHAGHERAAGAGTRPAADAAAVSPARLTRVMLWVFYQQQLTNVAREAARYAAIHSSTAICPTASWRDPNAPPASYPLAPYQCDGPAQGWPKTTAHALRIKVEHFLFPYPFEKRKGNIVIMKICGFDFSV